jgi:hypothetical protein
VKIIAYRYTIKSRLQKKVQQFAREELPLLVEQGYLDLTEFCKVELTENCKVSNALVAQAGRELPTYEIEHNMVENKSLGGIWTPDLYLLGAKSLWEEDLYLTKVTNVIELLLLALISSDMSQLAINCNKLLTVIILKS